MTHDDTDAGEDLLANIDLHAWRVPPPVAVHRASHLVGALSPAAPAKRPRLKWLVAGLVLLNAAIAAVLVIVLARPAPERQTVVVQPAGGGTVDAQVRDLLRRLDVEQKELERKLAEIEELRSLVIELSEKVRQYEERDRREKTVTRRQPPVTRQPIDPYDPYDARNTSPPSGGACDEVSCVLGNYQGGCCEKFKKSSPPPPPKNDLPESLTRETISTAMASVKSQVTLCGDVYKVHGKVKVNVKVSPNGAVTNVEIAATPDPQLGACVAGVIQHAVFAKSQVGGSFSYPFVF
ncbi:MAG TPA: hypothetical protein VMZ53_21540 [Kofleriaceae bacterium]|nr:hypothetical protein [Kofleriaceae bacterium]